jgi:hypothetical protein
MKYTIFFILINTVISYCSHSAPKKNLLIVKQYRNNEFIKELHFDGTQFMDTGIYCLVHYDSSQTKILDSSFYLNGVLNGYSLKRENAFFVIGNYVEGKKFGWFDFLSNDSLIRSNYYSNDTLYQSTYHLSGFMDSSIVFVREVDMSFEYLSKRNTISNNFSWIPIEFNDSLYIYVVTGVNRLHNSKYYITDDLDKKIVEFNNSYNAYFKFKISNNIFHKYYLILNVYNGDRLNYTKKDLYITTPWRK